MMQCLVASPQAAVVLVAMCTVANYVQGLVDIHVHPQAPYTGSVVTFSCTTQIENPILSMKLTAHNKSGGADSILKCTFPGSLLSSNDNILPLRFKLLGCSNKLHNVTFVLPVTRWSETDYSCQLEYFVDFDTLISESTKVALYVRVAPDIPLIQPNQLDFNEGENAQIKCSAFNGLPAAELILNMTNNRSDLRHSATGSEIASLSVDISSKHHLAIITCTPSNHILPSLILKKQITVNHIYAKESIVKIPVHGNESVLNCSSYIESYPQASYFWSVPKEFSSAKEPDYAINIREAGLSFVCIATNTVTGSSVSVMFLTYESGVSETNNVSPAAFSDPLITVLSIVATAFTLAAVTTVALIMFCRRQYQRRSIKSQQVKVSDVIMSSKKPRDRKATLDAEEMHLYEDITEYTMTCKVDREMESLGKPQATTGPTSYISLRLRSAAAEGDVPNDYSQLEYQ